MAHNPTLNKVIAKGDSLYAVLKAEQPLTPEDRQEFSTFFTMAAYWLTQETPGTRFYKELKKATSFAMQTLIDDNLVAQNFFEVYNLLKVKRDYPITQ